MTESRTPHGAIALADYPGDQVLIDCPPCQRQGRYNKARLIARFGAHRGLPDVLAELSASCPRRQDWRQDGPCQAGYPELVRAMWGGPYARKDHP